MSFESDLKIYDMMLKEGLYQDILIKRKRRKTKPKPEKKPKKHFPSLKRPCKKCDKMFTPETRKSTLCPSCFTKAHSRVARGKAK